ncbi:MAG: ribonuclease J [Chloroflexi bacterium]|nr:ribonuclease J [Chloroflexota bacterium]MCY4246416.1 ribonuclease J [Chloroflexota bacterium]
MARKKKFKITPIGGLGEIGKNMTLFEYGGDGFLIDCGIMFPANDMHGVDYIIPDFRWLEERADIKLHGVCFTHGHEDHIGATAHLLKAFPDLPLFATPLTTGLLQVKLKSARLLKTTTINTFEAGDKIQVGPFKLESFHVCHSIPDCVGYGINTPFGMVVHTGDYKFDNTPVHGRKTDYARLAGFAQRGVALLLADSTNSDKAGWTESEAVIAPALDRVFRGANGRIMVATFASLMSRVQQVVNAARAHKRKVCITGYTMSEYAKIARKLGYLDVGDDMLVTVAQAQQLPPHKIVFMVTGSQGEPSAVLGKLAAGRHRQLDVRKNDTIIFSSHPIPGNEEMVYRTINRLIERGAEVIYDAIESVHVSGHACQEEMRLMLNLTQPRHLIPVHGEIRHLHLHAKLAVDNGMSRDQITIIENGATVELDGRGVTVGERQPGGYVFVDGSSVGDIGRAVIRDREILAQDGFVLVSVNVDRRSGKLLEQPRIVSRGFVYLKDAEDFLDNIRDKVTRVVNSNQRMNGNRQNLVEESLGKLIYSETKRRPMIFSIVNEV